MRLLLALGASRGLAALAPVQVSAEIPGLVGGPTGAPAVIVIQEWWGITEGIKEHAEKIAEMGGYRVLIPDIYKGKVGVDAEEAHHLMSNLDFPKAVSEISAAAAFLKAEGSPTVGVTGFCMGGALAMGAVAASPDISCAAPFCAKPAGTRTLSKQTRNHWLPVALPAKPATLALATPLPRVADQASESWRAHKF